MSKENKEDELTSIIRNLSDKFKAERKEKEPCKELFKAGSTHAGLLRELNAKMTSHVLNACDVFEEIHGIKINKEQYDVLLALPLLAAIATSEAARNEGLACSEDKAYFVLSEQLIALNNKKNNAG